MYKLFLSFSVGLFILTPCFGLQKLTQKFIGERLTANVSKQELSGISIENDRIRSIYGNGNEYFYQADTNAGMIYVKPKLLSKKNHISLFLHTEKNKIIQLLLLPQNIPAENIIVKAIEKNSEHMNLSDISERRICELMRLMVNKKVAKPYYKVRPTQTFGNHTKVRNVRKHIIASYKSDVLEGDIYELKNYGSKNSLLEDKDFFGREVIAIAISKRTIKPHEKTILYVVKKV